MQDDQIEIPDPGPEKTPSWADQDAAKKEDRNWAKLDTINNRNDAWWLSTYGVVIVAITAIFALLFLASLVIWSFHYLAPSCWGWLDERQLGKVQSVLFSGGMGAVVSTIIQKQLSKNKP